MAHLVSQTFGACAAWIINLPPNTQVNQISFKCHKNERGIISKKTSDPIVRVEYSMPGGSSAIAVSELPKSDMTQEADERVKYKLHPITGGDPVIHRIAVCGVATKTLVADYADMELCNLQVNGKPVFLQTELQVRKDEGTDSFIKDVGHKS